ncbi:MAG: hypothetical protein MUQ26_07350, partial [Armatimonadetes bacterium]|nr:hypothetical protein [Armatimonadota bacterium]
MSPELAAGLTAFAGLCMVAGWITAFRNRGYLGLLGVAFLMLAGFLLALGRARATQDTGEASDQIILLSRVLLAVCILAFTLAIVSAARETSRRLREIRQGYREAEEAMLDIVKASLEKEAKGEAEPTRR